jgi:hypothetical protein
MRSTPKPVRVFLTGGLGNQLFQLSAGLAKAGDGRIILDSSFGNFKHSQKNTPELYDFNLSENIIIENKKSRNYFARKMFNLLLRISNKKQPFTNIKIRKLIRSTARFWLQLIYVRNLRIYASSATGFDSKLLETNTCRSIALIGYFQTYKYVEIESVFKLLNQIFPKSTINLTSAKEKLDLTRKALVLHIRMGDYTSETEFGLLSRAYFEKALDVAFAKDQFDDIWLFTNAKTDVMDAIPTRFHSKLINFSEFNLSTAETFQIMREADGYILSNSTFGWWAAELSLTNAPLVIAPTPWFRKLESPSDLIRKDWLQVDSLFLG